MIRPELPPSSVVFWPSGRPPHLDARARGFEVTPSESRSALGVVFKFYDAYQRLGSSEQNGEYIRNWLVREQYCPEEAISLKKFWRFSDTVTNLTPYSPSRIAKQFSSFWHDYNLTPSNIYEYGFLSDCKYYGNNSYFYRDIGIGGANYFYISSKVRDYIILSIISELEKSIEDGPINLDKIRRALRENIRVKFRIREILRFFGLDAEISSTHRWVHEFFLSTGISPPRTVSTKLASQLRLFTVPKRGGGIVPNLRSSSRGNRTGCVSRRTSKINRQGDLRRIDIDPSIPVTRRHQHIRLCPPDWGALRGLGR